MTHSTLTTNICVLLSGDNTLSFILSYRHQLFLFIINEVREGMKREQKIRCVLKYFEANRFRDVQL